MAEEKKQKSTFMQLVLFILMSLVAFAAQMLIGTFGDKLLALCGVDNVNKTIKLGIESYTMAGVIAYAIANIVAKVVSYILNRKKTFNAVNNLVFSMTVYIIMCVVLIVVETIIAGPLADAYYKWLSQYGVAYELCKTISMITYSIVDFAIVFLMEKFVIMNDNLFKGSKKAADGEEAPADAAVEVETEEAPVAEEPAKEEAVVEAPVEEDDSAEEEAKAKAEAEAKAKAEEEAKAKAEAEAKAKAEEEAKAKAEAEAKAKAEEEAKAKAEAEAKAAEEEKAEEAPVEEAKEEEAPVVEEPAKEEAPAEVKEEKPAKAAPAKKAATKAKNAGKIEFDLRADGYHFDVSAINGQLMYESQGFASLDTAQSGFETFKKALENGTATVYQDKRKLWRFVINKRYVGEGYKTRAQAEAAIESVKRDALLGTICDVEEDPEEKAAFAAAKKSFNKGTGVNWDEALKAPAKTFGKFEINGREDRGFYFSLFANNGQLLYCSRYYASEDSCEDAITTFKKACYLDNFFFDKDKFGNWRFILKGTGAGICYYGESYSTKDAAISSSESVKKFAMSAKIVVAEDED